MNKLTNKNKLGFAFYLFLNVSFYSMENMLRTTTFKSGVFKYFFT